MKTTLVLAMSLLMAGTATAQTLKTGIDPANLDTSVSPGENFFLYAAGGWMKNHPLDDEHSSNGAFVDLSEQNTKRIQDLILQFANTPQEKGSLGQKIGSLYNLRMDSVRLNREGWAPLKPTLERIAAIKDRKEYQLVTAQIDRRGEETMMYGIGVGADMRNASMNIVSVGQGGLGLGTRDYYLNDDEQTKRVREAYKTYMKNLFQMVGNDSVKARQKMEAVMAIETRIAKASYGRVELRDIDKNYHKMSYNQLVTDFPGIDWGNVFLASGFPAFDCVDVGQPEPIHEVEKILAEASLDDLKSYAEIKVISGAASQLSDDFRAEDFKLSSTISGQTQDRPRWKRAVGTVSGVLGEAIGKLYVEKYFPESSKKRMLDLVHNLQTALAQRIDEATWMSAETKLKAKDKLDNFIVKIGYPDKWRDYSNLDIDANKSYWENVQNARRFQAEYEYSQLGKPVDKERWYMTPQTVNAYYEPSSNEICFPAGILQSPYFDPNADEACNYGAIGVVIGHEMTHGFDDQGRNFDHNGNMIDWWTAEDAAKFQELANKLGEQYSAEIVADDVHANGQFTMGENIADHGGLRVAFSAFKKTEQGKGNELIDGFTPDQRFFLSYANVWAANITKEEMLRRTKVDPHSLGVNRVNVAIRNLEEFFNAFNIQPEMKMWRDPADRVIIW